MSAEHSESDPVIHNLRHGTWALLVRFNTSRFVPAKVLSARNTSNLLLLPFDFFPWLAPLPPPSLVRRPWWKVRVSELRTRIPTPGDGRKYICVAVPEISLFGLAQRQSERRGEGAVVHEFTLNSRSLHCATFIFSKKIRGAVGGESALAQRARVRRINMKKSLAGKYL